MMLRTLLSLCAKRMYIACASWCRSNRHTHLMRCRTTAGLLQLPEYIVVSEHFVLYCLQYWVKVNPQAYIFHVYFKNKIHQHTFISFTPASGEVIVLPARFYLIYYVLTTLIVITARVEFSLYSSTVTTNYNNYTKVRLTLCMELGLFDNDIKLHMNVDYVIARFRFNS